MYVAKSDAITIREGGGWEMMQEYRKKFGEGFPPFNYADFPGTEEISPGQMWLNTLKSALEADEPFRMISHRYDFFDH